MTDINTTIAEVKRLDAEATPGEWLVDTANWHGLQYGVTSSMGVICPCREHAANDDKHNAALIAYYRTAAPMLAAEVERLRAEVERLTRDRDRLTGYVRAARQLSRDAHTHLLEERPEETARAIYRVICALASAEKEGDDQ
jgi:outer membrane murein-binding lipoprotein Lpp